MRTGVDSKPETVHRGRRRRAFGAFAAVYCLLSTVYLLVPGCAGRQNAPTTRPMTASERSDKALRDPFGYSPDFSDADTGGGGASELDHKGLRRDLANVIMP